MQILVIEDEKKVASALKTGLEAEHYEVEVAHTGEEGFFLAGARTFDHQLLRNAMNKLIIPHRTRADRDRPAQPLRT